ncbi:hypothetical protein HanXRQr2_Chr14g0636081 [Helianthus annuus]|uniref:Uncharacterized protein n=1 Tax=Helianthus annuus TaxID=4232 RepID=A0A251SFL4_HELAN|nr:hypothetical protein HanXRQr2_Chr14g0636081 [Helianthus annuus]KAJ0839708.1 hypothetical protein HanPSC8_Chr14g0610061 [Helianthus annuus]
MMKIKGPYLFTQFTLGRLFTLEPYPSIICIYITVNQTNASIKAFKRHTIFN